MARIFGNSSDESWEWYGRHDPYFGVVTDGAYRKINLSAENRERFFSTGFDHVDRVLGVASSHFGFCRMASCMDFGCGVGRLIIPFARKFAVVEGVDVSWSMLEEARRNCESYGVTNVRFALSLGEVVEKFDLVHSYVVLQHIVRRRGMALIGELLKRVKPGGLCFLHLTVGRDVGLLRMCGSFVRRNFGPAHALLNRLEGKPIGEAYMQINRYNTNELVSRLYDEGVRKIWMELENHNGPYSVFLAFSCP